MSNGTLSEEVARKRAEEALNGGGDDVDPDDPFLNQPEQPQTEESQIGLGDEEPSDATDLGGDTGTVREPKGKVQTFEDYSANVPQNVPRGTSEPRFDYPNVAMATRELPPPAVRAISTGAYDFEVNPTEQPAVNPDVLASVGSAQQGTSTVKPPEPPEPEYAGIAEPAEASGTLTQVERGELVKPPAEAPSTLAQVERGELVKVAPGTAPRAVAVQTFDDYGGPPAIGRAGPVIPGQEQPTPVPGAKPGEEKPEPVPAAKPSEEKPTLVKAPQAGAVQTFDDYGAQPPAQPVAQAGTAPFQPDTSSSKRLNAIYNNPGAMGLTQSALRFGATPSGHYDTGHAFAQFPTREAGAAAQFSMWQNPALYKGHTLAGAITNWIGPGEHGEAEFIAQKLGVPLNTVITDEFLRSSMGIRLMQAQAQYEGQNVLTPEQWKRGQDWAYGGIKPSGTAELPSGTAAAQTQQPQAPAMRTLSPEEQTATQARVQAAIQQQDKVLLGLPEQTTSPVGLYNRLGSAIEGVSDARRLDYRNQVKAEITKEAQDYYKEPDPAKALARATSDANFGTVAGEVLSKVGPYFNQAVTAFNQSATVIDQNRLDDLAKAVHPQASADARKTFINSIVSEPDPIQRSINITHILGNLAQENPNNPALAALRATDIADSADRLANPEYQRRQKAEIDRQVAQNMRDLRPDPRLQGTPAQWWTEQLAQLPKNIVEGVTGPIGDSLLVSEIYQGTMERLRQENPGMSEDELKAKIGGSSATQVIAMMVLNRLSGGKLGTMVGQIENPAARIGASALMHTGIGSTIGAAQQVATNIAEGKPAFEGVPQAAGAGAVQALPGALISGLHGLERRTEEPVPPVTEQPPVVTPEQRPVTGAEILGPNVPDVSLPWYKPGALVTRAEERTAFSPQELAGRIDELRQQGWTPEQLQQVIENLQPEPDFTQRSVHLSPEALADLAPPTSMAEAMPFEPPTAVTESEPWVSKIANRFTAERIVNGELGPVEPGQGVTKEEMLARGLRMGPEEINQHVSDLMNGVGDPRLQASAIRTEEARLSQRSHAASLFSEANPTDQQARIDADNAFKDLTDFHNGPVAKLKNNWHAQGMTLQGEIPTDLSTFNGLREQFLKDVGKPPPPEMEPVMRKTAKKVRDASVAEATAMKNLGAEIEKQSARRRLPTDEELRMRIMERVKDMPCST